MITLPFHQVEIVLFNTRNISIHQRKKKNLSPAFSATNLGDYETQMTKQLEKLMRCLKRHIEKSDQAQLDFNAYCESGAKLGKLERYFMTSCGKLPCIRCYR